MQMETRVNWTIKLKLFVSMLVLGIFPFMLSGLISYFITVKDFTSEVKERLQGIPGHMAHQVEAFFYFRRNDTLQLSHSPLLTEASEEARDRYLGYLFDLYRPYSCLRVCDESGRVVAAADGSGLGLDVSRKSWFQEGRKISFQQFISTPPSAPPAADSTAEKLPSSGVYVEDVHLSEFAPGGPVVSFTCPIYDAGGNFRGVVHNEVKMSFIAEAVQDIGMGEKAFATLIRKDGIVIADRSGVSPFLDRSVAPLRSFREATTGKVGVLRERDSYGMDSFVSYAPLSGYSTYAGLGWSLLISQGVDEIYAYAKDQARVFSLMVLVGTTLILVGGYFFLDRWISKPIHRLTEGVKALGTEGFEAKLEEIGVGTSDEIGRLTVAFQQMVQDLRAKEEKQRELQEQLIQADKLASLGELSAGIAHEIGNPLTAIKTTAQVMEEEIEPDSPHHEYIRRIIKEIDRLNAILKAFFSFAKPQRPHLTYCDVRDLVREVLFLIGKDAANQKVTIREEYTEALPVIKVDFQQIQQVLLNLCLNAFQAMPQGGELSIKAESAGLSEEGATAIVLSVSDSGKGINPEHLKKIFDPFFTTRPQGTGLGLSIAYQIVDRHGGKIKVESQPGQGTIFHLLLPVFGPPSQAEPVLTSSLMRSWSDH